MLAPLETALTTEWRPLAGLAGIAAEWRALARRAVEPNIFYEPAFALAAAPVLGSDAGAVLVRSLEPRRLIGLFPCRIERRRYGVRLPLLAGWTHPTRRSAPRWSTARPSNPRSPVFSITS